MIYIYSGSEINIEIASWRNALIFTLAHLLHLILIIAAKHIPENPQLVDNVKKKRNFL